MKKLEVKIDGYWRTVKKIVLEDISMTDDMFPITDIRYVELNKEGDKE